MWCVQERDLPHTGRCRSEALVDGGEDKSPPRRRRLSWHRQSTTLAPRQPRAPRADAPSIRLQPSRPSRFEVPAIWPREALPLGELRKISITSSSRWRGWSRSPNSSNVSSISRRVPLISLRISSLEAFSAPSFLTLSCFGSILCRSLSFPLFFPGRVTRSSPPRFLSRSKLRPRSPRSLRG